MIVLPIVERELRTAARRPNTYRVRWVAAAIACGVAAWVLMSARERLLPDQVGKSLFLTLAYAAFLASLLPGILLTADCISEEKREGTLGLLFLTDLQGRDIVLGKLAATSLNALFGLLTALPVLAIPLVMGGVTLAETARMAIVLVNTLFFSLSVGMLVSAFAWRERRAMIVTGALLFLAAFGFDLIGIPIQFLSLREPLRTAFDQAFAASPTLFYGTCLWVHLAAWALLGWACWVVPRRVEEKFDPPIAPDEARELWPKAEVMAGEQTEQMGMAKLGDGNPVEWLADRDGRPSAWMWLSILISGILWMTTHPFLNPGSVPPEMAVAFGLLFHAFLKFWVGYDAASRFSGDRRCGALEMLLSTSLTVREILEGQLRAMAKRFFKPLMCVLALDLALFMTGFTSESPRTGADGRGMLLLIQFVVLLTFFIDTAAAAVFGMWQGLRMRRAGRAALRTAGQVLVLPTAVFSILAFIALAAGGRSPHEVVVLAGLWLLLSLFNAAWCCMTALNALHRDFRELATLQAAGGPAISVMAVAAAR